MPLFSASPLVEQLEENLFSTLEKILVQVDTTDYPLIDLSSGSPRQSTAATVVATLQEAVTQPENHEYPSFWGKLAVRQAIADFYQRQYGVELDPDSDIAIFQGAHIGVTGSPVYRVPC